MIKDNSRRRNWRNDDISTPINNYSGFVVVHDPIVDKWECSKDMYEIGDPFKLCHDSIYLDIGIHKCCLLFSYAKRRKMEYYCIILPRHDYNTIDVSERVNGVKEEIKTLTLPPSHIEALNNAFNRISRLILNIEYTCVYVSHDLDDMKSVGCVVTKIHPRPLTTVCIASLPTFVKDDKVQLISTTTENEVMKPHYRNRHIQHQQNRRNHNIKKSLRFGRRLDFDNEIYNF